MTMTSDDRLDNKEASRTRVESSLISKREMAHLVPFGRIYSAALGHEKPMRPCSRL